jgi:hypothetical protein
LVDKKPIVNGKFDLLVSGYGSVTVFLDMNGDGVYQKNEPDWFRGAASAVTPADFDAEKDLHIDITEIPPTYANRVINVALCADSNLVDGGADGDTCSVQRLGMGVTPGVFAADVLIVPSNVSLAMWFTDPNVDSPLDQSQPHFIGSLTKPPCAVDGDLTTCSLSFGDFVIGDGGAVRGDASSDP